MKLTIRNRLLAVLILAALIPTAIVAGISYQRARSALITEAFARAALETASTSKEMLTFMEQFEADLLAFSEMPPVQRIIRAQDNGGIDPQSNAVLAVWVNDHTQYFRAISQNNLAHQQLRYLNRRDDEIVRVDHRNGQVILVSGTDRLQNKGKNSHLTAARALQAGEVAVSALILNREQGHIELPHVPVLRFSTPIYDPAGRFRGVVVTNVSAKSFLERL